MTKSKKASDLLAFCYINSDSGGDKFPDAINDWNMEKFYCWNKVLCYPTIFSRYLNGFLEGQPG
ncbi:hypothetical protein GTP46_06075 [Duganella sp. FT135W]|uniref:Uncharacterized protein n=1 Tax=Duganella flavida TaxID=2692175 RepID=A0A6L8K421_9BURK|nr:hypothetical protein [Duganella flavida]MYM22206.1 hypothetical protein [Duganella flavida]